MRNGQVMYLPPGIRGFGFFQPDSTTETFRLRNSIWNYSNWFLLGEITDTAQPDIATGSNKTFIEYRDAKTQDLKYILIDDSVLSVMEFREKDFVPFGADIDFETTVVKTTSTGGTPDLNTANDFSELESKQLSFWQRYLGQLVLAVSAAIGLGIYAYNKNKATAAVSNTTKIKK